MSPPADITYYLKDACRLLDGVLDDLASRVHVGTIRTPQGAGHSTVVCRVTGPGNTLALTLTPHATVAQLGGSLGQPVQPYPAIRGRATARLVARSATATGRCFLLVAIAKNVVAGIAFEAPAAAAEYAAPCAAAAEVGSAITEPFIS